jgi:integrase
MRQGECLGLRWEDIDLEAGLIHVRHEILRITGQGLVLGPPKSKTSVRELPILGPLAYALKHTEHRGDYVFYGHAKEPRLDYQAWKDLLVRAGVCEPGTKLGDMPELAAARTTTSTLLRDAGVADTVNRDVLGHSTVTVNQESYQRTDAVTIRAALLALMESVGQIAAETEPVRLEVINKD